MAASEALLSIEDYLSLPDLGYPNELVRGKIVRLPVPTPRHGQICGEIVWLIGRYLDAHDLGHLVCNDSAIITERNPDTVRGADVAFYSYQRMPRGPLPDGYLDVSPELVFEVRSPTDRWGVILTKVGEYLESGVTVVCVLDQMKERCLICRNEESVQVLVAEEELTIPDVLGDFRTVVKRLFE